MLCMFAVSQKGFRLKWIPPSTWRVCWGPQIRSRVAISQLLREIKYVLQDDAVLWPLLVRIIAFHTHVN